jgi:hypothetical protein
MPYRVKKYFLQFPQLRTVIDGKAVALVEAYQYEKRGTVTSAPKTVLVPLATQSELKAIFERGDKTVERYEEEKPKGKQKEEAVFVGAAETQEATQNEPE